MLNIIECTNVVCEEGEFCRDGKCQKFQGILCFSDYNCGPLISLYATSTILQCKLNKCELRNNLDEVLYKHVDLKCDPGQSLQGNKCVPQEGLCLIKNIKLMLK